MKEFSKEEIQSFKTELYKELIQRGETQEKASFWSSYTDDDLISIMEYNTPDSYAELLTL